MNTNTDLQALEKMSIDDLIAHINHLIAYDFSKLLYLLYAVDVPERKLKQLLTENPGENAGKIIAQLMLERQDQKRKSREQFSQDPADIPEEDRW